MRYFFGICTQNGTQQNWIICCLTDYLIWTLYQQHKQPKMWGKIHARLEVRCIAVVDPRFPKGGVNFRGVRQPIIFQIFGRKLHENERIWTKTEAPPLDPPLHKYQRFLNKIVSRFAISEFVQDTKIFIRKSGSEGMSHLVVALHSSVY